MKRGHNKKSHRVNQVDIEFTKKPITAWGGIASLIAKFLEELEEIKDYRFSLIYSII